MGDFRKNVQGIQSGRNAPNFRSLITGEANRGPEPAELLSKIEALEERNKALAKMLEESVSELWECQKDALDGKGSEKQSIESLSLAIAKVQVMQVYLEDSSIPLPADDPAPFVEEESAAKSTLTEVSEEPSVPSSEAGDSSATTERSAPHSAKAASAPTSRKPTPSTVPQSATTGGSSEGNTSRSASASSAQTLGRNFSPGSRPRSSLTSSSFSWMLGQEPDTTPASSFAAASSLSTFQPLEKRERRRNKPSSGAGSRHRDASGGGGGSEGGGGNGNKAFLFGDTDDEFMAGPLGPGSTASGRMVKKGKEVLPIREVFDLDEVGNNGSGASSNNSVKVGGEESG